MSCPLQNAQPCGAVALAYNQGGALSSFTNTGAYTKSGTGTTTSVSNASSFTTSSSRSANHAPSGYLRSYFRRSIARTNAPSYAA